MSKVKKIFVVDDDNDDINLFKEVLQEIDAAIECGVAEDGREAMDILTQSENDLPDLIFLDLNMPRMDGKECLRRLKADESLQHIPVLIYTTSSQSKDIEETMMSGAVCFITKPTTVRELESIIRAVISSPSGNLVKTLRTLSNQASTFIVC